MTDSMGRLGDAEEMLGKGGEGSALTPHMPPKLHVKALESPPEQSFSPEGQATCRSVESVNRSVRVILGEGGEGPALTPHGKSHRSCACEGTEVEQSPRTELLVRGAGHLQKCDVNGSGVL
jgi:hypothetical protein